MFANYSYLAHCFNLIFLHIGNHNSFVHESSWKLAHSSRNMWASMLLEMMQFKYPSTAPQFFGVV
jgi:hypothetical protein